MMWFLQNHRMVITDTIGFTDESPEDTVRQYCLAFGRKAAQAILEAVG
jgi:hypothetical protein